MDRVYSSIAVILETARANAYRAVNQVMVQAYWEIGRVIVEEEQKGKKRAGYGVAQPRQPPAVRQRRGRGGRQFKRGSNHRFTHLYYPSLFRCAVCLLRVCRVVRGGVLQLAASDERA